MPDWVILLKQLPSTILKVLQKSVDISAKFMNDLLFLSRNMPSMGNVSIYFIFKYQTNILDY